MKQFFLGITLDKVLKWKPHIDILKSNLSKVTGIIYRLREIVNNFSLKHTYFSLAYPHLLYCCALWGGSYKTYIDNLFVEQNKLIRVMSRRQGYDHGDPLFITFNLLKLPDIMHLQTCLFVHRALHSYPSYNDFLKMDNSSARTYNNLRIPLCRTSHAQQNIRFRGIKL